MTRRRRALALLAVAGMLATGLVVATRGEPARSEHLAETADYLPGRAADTFLPSRAERAPVVVLVPGGGWRTPDRSGLTPLAEELTDAGAVAVTVEYLTPDQGARFPRPVRDVACAAAYAVEQARTAGVEPGPVVLLGHSAGAHLAALAALAAARFQSGCPYPPVAVDGFAGLAGPYDVAAWSGLVRPLFGAGPEEEPGRWAAGDPLRQAGLGDRSGLRALLAHGDADELVPTYESRAMASALRRAGATVTLDIVPGADHTSIYSAPTAAPLVTRWLRGFAGPTPGSSPR